MDTEQTLGNFDDRVSANYDVLMAKVVATLDTEFAKNNITGDKTANVIAQMIQPVIMASIEMSKQEVLLDEQEALLQAQTNLAAEQKNQLTNSVTYNNKIKALDSYGDMIGTMGAGGLVISSDMWTAFFNMVSGLNSDMGTNPASTTVTKL